MSGNPELKINQEFAQKYEKYRQKEELQKRKCLTDAKCHANSTTWGLAVK